MHGRTWFPVSSGLLTWEHYQRIGPAWMIFLWMIHEQRRPRKGEGNTGAVHDGEPLSYEQLGTLLHGMPARTVEKHIALLEHEHYIRSEWVHRKGKRYYVCNPIRWALLSLPKNGEQTVNHSPNVGSKVAVLLPTNGGGYSPNVGSEQAIRTKVQEPITNPLPPDGGGDELFLLTDEVESPVPHRPKTKKQPDSRYQPFREKLERFWTYMNPDISSANWNAADAGQLGKLLRDWPALTIKEFHQWLVNYSDSDGINQPDRPHEFLPKIHRYADGSKDRFGKPREEVRA